MFYRVAQEHHLQALWAGAKRLCNYNSNIILATSNAILYSGAKPIFIDIDKDTYNISAELVEKMIKKKKKKKKI